MDMDLLLLQFGTVARENMEQKIFVQMAECFEVSSQYSRNAFSLFLTLLQLQMNAVKVLALFADDEIVTVIWHISGCSWKRWCARSCLMAKFLSFLLQRFPFFKISCDWFCWWVSVLSLNFFLSMLLLTVSVRQHGYFVLHILTTKWYKAFDFPKFYWLIGNYIVQSVD